MKKLQFTTNNPSATTDYLAADNTWKTIPGGGGGVPYTGATADVDLGTHSLTADTIGIGTTAGSEKLHIDGGASTTRVKIDADNGVSRILSFRTDDVQRWALRVDGTESGSNSGADFQVRRYNDAGAHIDNPIAINRSTGNITTAQNVNGVTPTEMGYLSGASSNIQVQLNSKISSSRSFLFGTSGNATVAANTTVYNGFATGANVTLANEFTRIVVLPLACNLSNFMIRCAAQPAGNTFTVTLRKNGVDTAAVITVAGGSAGGNYTTTTSVAFAAGDIVSFKIANVGLGVSGALICSSVLVSL
jgi:hypothetical protein